jgi:hypothetical protein
VVVMVHVVIEINVHSGGQDSVVNIAACNRLDGLEFEL